MDKRKPAFIGLDIETTGLDPKYDLVLELGIVIFDHTMHPMEARSWTIRQPLSCPAAQNMAPVVRDMHIKSGLAEEMSLGRGVSLNEAEHQAIEFIREHTKEKLPMLGSSITFDRSFLAEDMPDLLDAFHHRSMDATSVRLATVAMLSERNREEAEERIEAESHSSRQGFLTALRTKNQHQRPHRPIYDICGSAALAHACFYTVVGLTNTGRLWGSNDD